jgi:hypothetical protein
VKENREFPEEHIPITKKCSGRARKTRRLSDSLLMRCVLNAATPTAKQTQELPYMYSLWWSAYPQHSALPLKRSETSSQACSLETPPDWENDVDQDGLFAIKYKHRTPEQWDKVIFSDDTKLRILSVVSRVIRRRSDPAATVNGQRFTVKTTKHCDIIMVWACFMRDVGRGGMYVLPKNVTMNGDRRMDILEHRLLPFITIRPATTSRTGPPYCKSRRSCSTWRTRSWRS